MTISVGRWGKILFNFVRARAATSVIKDFELQMDFPKVQYLGMR